MSRKLIKIKNYLKCYQITCGFIPEVKKSKTFKGDKEESRRCSLSRSCAKIKDYVLSNKFDYFCTFTIADTLKFDIVNAIKFFNKEFLKYSKIAKRKGYDFKYIYVFELTKNKGVHVHGFFSGFYDLYYNDYNHLSSLYFDNIGFQCFNQADKCNPFYLIKYILKDEVTEDKRKYHASKNLNLPVVDTFHDNYDEFKNFNWTFENSYCKMITIAR